MLAKTMLYIAGLAHNIWGILVDTIEVDEHEVEDYLAQGWFHHPFDVRDQASAEEQARASALAQASNVDDGQDEIAKLRQQLEENQKLLDEANLKLSQPAPALVSATQTLNPGAGEDSTTLLNGGATSTTTAPTAPTADEIELALKLKLAEEAATKGVKIDGRWGSEKIQAALDKAAKGGA